MISVIMSAYNESDNELRNSIESILKQTYRDIEFIIVNDNPENEKVRQVLEYYSGLDSRVKVLENEKNLGLSKSLNKGIEKAGGEYIARMDADDISLPDRFEKQLAFLNRNNLDLVSAFTINIDQDGNELPQHKQSSTFESIDIRKIMRFTDIVKHPTVLGKAEVFKEMGGYRELVPAEDYDLWLRMLSADKAIGCMNERVLKYRIRSESISRKNEYKQFLASRYVRMLYKQRTSKGLDCYSFSDYTSYLERHHFDSPKAIDKYKRCFSCYKMCMESVKKKQLFKSFVYAGASVINSFYGVEMLWNGFMQNISRKSN